MTYLMVEATGVTKDYKISRGLFRGKEVLRAVDKVAISVNRGETLAVVGESGCGKTTLANIIANSSDRPLFTLSAISSCVKEVREIMEKAKKGPGLFTTKNPILFIDEIHRLNLALLNLGQNLFHFSSFG